VVNRRLEEWTTHSKPIEDYLLGHEGLTKKTFTKMSEYLQKL